MINNVLPSYSLYRPTLVSVNYRYITIFFFFQLDKFRQIMKTARRQDGKDSTFLVDDFRPLQILNNRKIYSNRPTKPHVMYTKNNSHRLVPVEFMIAVLVIFAALKAHY